MLFLFEISESLDLIQFNKSFIKVITTFIIMVEFDKEISSAVKWLATEHSYFKLLKKDLEELRIDLKTVSRKKQVKEIHAALRDFTFIGKAERRLNNHEQLVERGINDIKENYMPSVIDQRTENTELIKRIHIEAAQLILYASYYQGKILLLLRHLEHDVENDEIEQAQAVLMEVEETISDTEQWIAALSLDLITAKKLVVDILAEQAVIISRSEFVQQIAKDKEVKGAVYGVNSGGLGIIKDLGYYDVGLMRDFFIAWDKLFEKSTGHMDEFPRFICRVLGSEVKDDYVFRLIWSDHRNSAREAMAGFSLWIPLLGNRLNVAPGIIKRILHDPTILIDVFNIRSKASEDKYFRQLYYAKLKINKKNPGYSVFDKNLSENHFWEWNKCKLRIVFE
jgi:hypothetical protein